MPTSSLFLTGYPHALLYGLLLDKSRLSNPNTIRDQFRLKSNTHLQAFSAAAGSGAVMLGMLDLFYRVSGRPALLLTPKAFAPVGDIMGGLITGAGMALGGSIPGTLWAQIGCGRWAQGLIGLLGAICGGAAYGYLHPQLGSLVTGGTTMAKLPFTLNEALGLPYWLVALPFGAALIYGAFAVSDRQHAVLGQPLRVPNQGLGYMLQEKLWDPVASGLLMGSLLFGDKFMNGPLRATTDPIFAISAGIMKYTDASIPMHTFFGRYLFRMNRRLQEQLLCDALIETGAGFSAYMSGEMTANTNFQTKKGGFTTKDAMKSFFGGFLMQFGAGMSGGIGGNDGQLGVAQLSLGSISWVLAQLAGGFVAAQVFDSLER